MARHEDQMKLECLEIGGGRAMVVEKMKEKMRKRVKRVFAMVIMKWIFDIFGKYVCGFF